MKTRTVIVTHPVDGGRSPVIINPYFEIGDKVLLWGAEEAVVIADGGPMVMSSADAWVEQYIKIRLLDGTEKLVTSGDVKAQPADQPSVPF